MHTHRSMAVSSPWIVSNLTMYSTPLIFTEAFSIGEGVESIKLGILSIFHAQLVILAA